MRKLTLLVATMALVVASGALFAQNWDSDPLYGEYALESGFTSPHEVAVMAGGSDDVLALGITDATGGTCAGQINASAPDVRVYYSGGAFLRFFVQSGADTTLLVNMPDATFRCSDDSVGLNPVVDLADAPAGQYDIWIGMFWAGTPQAATLSVTEQVGELPTP